MNGTILRGGKLQYTVDSLWLNIDSKTVTVHSKECRKRPHIISMIADSIRINKIHDNQQMISLHSHTLFYFESVPDCTFCYH
jgi:hypothetical protein